MSTIAYHTSDIGFFRDNQMIMPSYIHSMQAIEPRSSVRNESHLMRSISHSSSDSTATNKGYQCKDELMLPSDFQPSAYSVICGRGRRCTEAFGNRRLAVIASLYAQRYANASKKEEKSHIVSEIHEIIRSACPDSRHSFVRYSKGKWWRVQNLHAREKIGTVLRDSLHSKYKSSTKSKVAKRKMKIFQKKLTKQSNSPFLINSLDDELSEEELENLFE